MEKKSEISIVGLIYGVLYIICFVFIYIFIVDIKPENLNSAIYLSRLSFKVTIISIICLAVMILISSWLVKKTKSWLSSNSYYREIRSKEIDNNVPPYTWKEVTYETIEWISELLDVVLSIVLPLIISFYFFSDKNNFIEQAGAMATLLIMPTFIITRLRGVFRVVIKPLWQTLYFLCKITVSYINDSNNK
ncbi:hypothetical protein CBF34_07115 [Vagococcus penaei]|uniref:hypothetical protein n=1 Tax=Vagococcus penaei TaxID=633807 RepID=UPI000F8850E1|nr:hypothetical protein [Vagococcus penaei]RSU01421.1 hypothetical protein CBF34_07115 [Vagococcus penaei]